MAQSCSHRPLQVPCRPYDIENIDIWHQTDATINNPWGTMSASAQAPVAIEAGVKGEGITNTDEAPANAVTVAPKKKEAPPESQESIRLRTWVIASFWAIIIFVGLPIWWKTTTIHRENLPLDQMMDWADGRVRFKSSTCFNADNHRRVAQSSRCGYR